MKQLKQYKIPFSGLISGKHNFEFEVGDAFFDCYEYSLVKQGNLLAQVELQKQENMLIVNFVIEGTIKLTCDVCLAEFDAPLAIKERVLVKFTSEDWEDDTEEVIVLNRNDYELDIAELLYEYINVQVPYYSRCSEQGQNITCNPEMLAMFTPDTTAEEEESSNPDEKLIDPRWAALKNIKNN